MSASSAPPALTKTLTSVRSSCAGASGGELAFQVLDLPVDLADLDLRVEDGLLRLGDALADQAEELAPSRAARAAPPLAGAGRVGSCARLSISVFCVSAACTVACRTDRARP